MRSVGAHMVLGSLLDTVFVNGNSVGHRPQRHSLLDLDAADILDGRCVDDYANLFATQSPGDRSRLEQGAFSYSILAINSRADYNIPHKFFSSPRPVPRKKFHPYHKSRIIPSPGTPGEGQGEGFPRIMNNSVIPSTAQEVNPSPLQNCDTDEISWVPRDRAEVRVLLGIKCALVI